MTMRAAARVKLYYGENQFKLNVDCNETFQAFHARIKLWRDLNF